MEFGARDLFRDRATTWRFTSVLGLQMGQILPASFISLFLPVIFREQGLPLDMYWVFALLFLVTLNGLALPSFLDVTFQAARLKRASRSQAATDYTTQIVTLMAGLSLSTAVGGWLAEHLGWFYYFLTAGILISGVCSLLYGLFDHIEALVDARDVREAGEVRATPATGDPYAPRRL